MMLAFCRITGRCRRYLQSAVFSVLLVALGACDIVNRDPLKNPLEIYRSAQNFEEVTGRFKTLLKDQAWLRWITRSSGCFDAGMSSPDEWRMVCGMAFSGKLDPTKPEFKYHRWMIVTRADNGTKILTTKAPVMLIGRYHPNTEIFDKAGIKAEFAGMRQPG